jgi:hypothetical protein
MIREAVRQAVDIHRQMIETTYAGKCCIYEKRGITDPITKITKQGELLIFSDIPCRLSYQSVSSATPGDGAYKAVQTIKLFLSPEVTINPGSKIVVLQDGLTAAYRQSGIPAHYGSHQEVILEGWDGWV